MGLHYSVGATSKNCLPPLKKVCYCTDVLSMTKFPISKELFTGKSCLISRGICMKVQLSVKFFKLSDIATYHNLSTFKTVVIPASPLPNLKAPVSKLNTVPGISLTIMCTFGDINFGANDK